MPARSAGCAGCWRPGARWSSSAARPAAAGSAASSASSARPLLSPLLRQRLRFFVGSEQAADLARLVALAEEGAFVPVVERTWPLVDAAAAIDHLAAGRVRGKVVVTV